MPAIVEFPKVVQDAVREIKQKGQEVFVPLIHRPGEAQVDFGFALVNVNGQLRKLPFFVMTLPYSDAIFVQVYERMSTEIYWDAHRRAFEFFDGVPVRITYDNDRTLAAEILTSTRAEADRGFPAAEEPLPVRHALLPGPASQREGRRGIDGQVFPAQLSGAGAAGSRSGTTQSQALAAVCRGPQAASAGSEGHEGSAASRRPDRVSASSSGAL